MTSPFSSVVEMPNGKLVRENAFLHAAGARRARAGEDITTQPMPVNDAGSAFNYTGMIRTGHIFGKMIMPGSQFPVAHGKCLNCKRGCADPDLTLHCWGEKGLDYEVVFYVDEPEDQEPEKEAEKEPEKKPEVKKVVAKKELETKPNQRAAV
jgi:hypothetical protein